VDIISLSFAVHGSELKGEIEALIEHAYANRTKKTIIFAAACNDGGLEPVPFPANHELVFSIRALTPYAKDTQFNPPPTKYDPNFAMLGVNVLSTWPTHLAASLTAIASGTTGPQLRDIEGIKCTTNYMDGTSFAAPLAAALVANVFAYHIEHGKTFVPKSYQVQSFASVKKILLLMSDETYHLRPIMPWLPRPGNIFSMRPSKPAVRRLNVAFELALES
jgi:hypothetical protein